MHDRLAPGWRAFALSIIMLFAASSLHAQGSPPPEREERPYDAQILRLAEILGAIHYLRELCGQNDGQNWRDQMRELTNAEGSSALRKARLVENFNKGYRGYSRTYRACNRSAIVAINRFIEQGAAITSVLIQDNK
ncbi:MAG: TIGR02301 family protein [Chitinophagales bacterium]|nr:TIGR02301 family protein [Hyphomicrobiales bacterium]